MAESHELRVEWRGAVAVLTLDRPHRRNALTAALYAQLHHAFDEADRRGAKGVLLTGTGGAFCAGQDLDERRPRADGTPYDLGASLRSTLNPLILRIVSAPYPVASFVGGVAAGAGASIAFASDIVVASRSARFLMAFSRIGLGPDGGASFFLPRLVGRARAGAMLLLAAPVDAQTAHDWGIASKLVDDDALDHELDGLAERLNAASAPALAATKRLLAYEELAAQLEAEALSQHELGLGEDYGEGVRAFLEKRPARFAATAEERGAVR